MDEDKNESSIVGFSYHNKSFHVIFNEEEYQKIHHGDIIVKNEITKQNWHAGVHYGKVIIAHEF